MSRSDEPRDDGQTYVVIGAAMQVHRELKRGYLEAVYHDALEIELGVCNVPFVREQTLPVHYRGQRLRSTYRADFVCYGSVVVELKAIARLTTHDVAQLMHYLKTARMRRGLLLNFGGPSLEVHRVVFDDDRLDG